MFTGQLILALLWKWGASVGWLACKVHKTGMVAKRMLPWSTAWGGRDETPLN